MERKDIFEAMLMKDCAEIYAKVMAGEIVFEKMAVAQIDGVTVYGVKFYFSKKHAYMEVGGYEPLYNDSISLFFEDESFEELTLEIVEAFMKKMVSTLPSLRFNAFDTKFVVEGQTRCHQNIKWVSGHKPCPVCRRSIEVEYDSDDEEDSGDE